MKIFGSRARLFVDVQCPSDVVDATVLLHEVDRAVACASGRGGERIDPGPVHLNFMFRENLAPVGGAVRWADKAFLRQFHILGSYLRTLRVLMILLCTTRKFTVCKFAFFTRTWTLSEPANSCANGGLASAKLIRTATGDPWAMTAIRAAADTEAFDGSVARV